MLSLLPVFFHADIQSGTDLTCCRAKYFKIQIKSENSAAEFAFAKKFTSLMFSPIHTKFCATFDKSDTKVGCKAECTKYELV